MSNMKSIVASYVVAIICAVAAVTMYASGTEKSTTGVYRNEQFQSTILDTELQPAQNPQR